MQKRVRNSRNFTPRGGQVQYPSSSVFGKSIELSRLLRVREVSWGNLLTSRPPQEGGSAVPQFLRAGEISLPGTGSRRRTHTFPHPHPTSGVLESRRICPRPRSNTQSDFNFHDFIINYTNHPVPGTWSGPGVRTQTHETNAGSVPNITPRRNTSTRAPNSTRRRMPSAGRAYGDVFGRRAQPRR